MSHDARLDSADRFNDQKTPDKCVHRAGDRRGRRTRIGRLGPTGTDGKPIEISLEVEATLSHYTPFIIAHDDKAYYPNFKDKGSGSVLGAAVYPSDSFGSMHSVSLNAHFVHDDLARSKLRSLGTAEPRDFIDACVEIRDDLQNRVGLNDYDVAVTLYGLLSRSRWIDRAAFRNQQECPDKSELALMQEFGLDITPLSRELSDIQREQIRKAFNRKLDQIAKSLKYAGYARKLKVFDSSLARENVWLLDPADAVEVPFERGNTARGVESFEQRLQPGFVVSPEFVGAVVERLDRINRAISIQALALPSVTK